MEIIQVNHIYINDSDWLDLKDCGTIHFTIDDKVYELKRGL